MVWVGVVCTRCGSVACSVGDTFWGAFHARGTSAVVSSREWFRFSLLQSSVIVSVAPLGGWLRGCVAVWSAVWVTFFGGLFMPVVSAVVSRVSSLCLQSSVPRGSVWGCGDYSGD